MAGIVDRPARFEARQRRSPAMSSNRSGVVDGRTNTGCNKPIALIDAESSASESSSKWFRGWFGFGSIEETEISCNPVPEPPPSRGANTVDPVGINASKPLPSPDLRATTHLQCHCSIRLCTR